MPNYALSIAYNGQHFHGWAKQPNTRTVQGVIEDALQKIFKQKVIANCSGRTDAGVHALMQVISFSADFALAPKALRLAMQAHVPSDIAINKAAVVKREFHARHSATSKTYLYKVSFLPPTPFTYPFFWNYGEKATSKISQMRRIAKTFIGTHDFLSYSTSALEDTKRTINRITATNVRTVSKSELMVLVF